MNNIHRYCTNIVTYCQIFLPRVSLKRRLLSTGVYGAKKIVPLMFGHCIEETPQLLRYFGKVVPCDLIIDVAFFFDLQNQ